MKNVVIYARAGSEAALERQVQMLKEHAEDQGWVVKKIYTDLVKGSFRNRGAFSHLVKDSRDGLVDVILVSDLSRLFCNREFASGIHNDLMVGKIGLATPDGFLNSADNMHFLPLLIAFHQMVSIQHGRMIAYAKKHRKQLEG